MWRRIASGLVVGLAAAVVSGQQTWTVDDDGSADFSSINDAIAAASDGDTVLVYPGVYTGPGGAVVDTQGKDLLLASVDGAPVTIIDGQDARRCIACVQGETRATVIRGFTLRNGEGQGDLQEGGGMYLAGSKWATK